jgi:mono/diheme cytochrome c family protein
MAYKTQLRTDPIVVLIIILLLGASYFHFNGDQPSKAPVPETAAPPAVSSSSSTSQHGHITFAESFFDFGTVVEGDIVKHTFKFKNDGAGKVKIVKTETSCGCTTATGALKEYAPGESGEMEVVIDTKGKKGIIVKTVTVTLENNEVATAELSLTMKLEPPPHPMISNVRNINAEAGCKTCHLESGEGQSGVFLYHRVCSQCHGKKGVGGFGGAHNDAKWQQSVDDAHIRKAIHEGLPDKGMPSFVDGVTPPLTEDQIGSLVQYIRSLAPH